MTDRFMNSPMLYLLAAMLFLSGCGMSRANFSKNNASGGKPAKVVSTAFDVRIMFVDGVRCVGFLKYLMGGFAGEVTLDPGYHELEIRYADPNRPSSYFFGLTCEPGKTYRVKSEVVGKAVRIWLEDAETGKLAGKVISSRNEPVTGALAVFDQSDFYSLKAPAESGWVVMYRDPFQMGVAKNGENDYESYVLQTSLIKTPELKTDAEFLAYIKEGKESDTDKNRFKIVREEYRIVPKDSKRCVEYSFLIEDQKAQKVLVGYKMMMLEGTSYVCQASTGSIVVDLSYSHRYFPGNKDDRLKEMTAQTFEGLKIK